MRADYFCPSNQIKTPVTVRIFPEVHTCFARNRSKAVTALALPLRWPQILTVHPESWRSTLPLVKGKNGQAVAYVYYEDEPGRRRPHCSPVMKHGASQPTSQSCRSLRKEAYCLCQRACDAAANNQKTPPPMATSANIGRPATRDMTPARRRPTSATRTSSTRCATPSCRPTASRISGDDLCP